MYPSQSNNERSLNKNEDIGAVKVIGIDNERRYCHVIRSIGDKVPARLVLYFLSWSGFLFSFMMRNDMNFAINAMIRNVTEANSSVINEVPSNGIDMRQKYDWSETTKSVILSSFYWWYVLSQVVGGIATQHFGTKKVFGWSQFATAVSSLAIPWAADIHYSLLILLRSVQGFASGLTWPAMYAIVGHWIPFKERSRFMSSFQGFSMGIGLTYPICGYIIGNFGWRYVFITTGSLGVLWSITWYLLFFNTPKKHPRISEYELRYIEENLYATDDKTTSNTESKHVPWKSILTSLPAWVIGITTFGRIWVHYIFIVSGPSFMMHILKFSYKTNGFLSGMPFICSYFSSLIFCYAADKMSSHNIMNLTNIRKLFTALSQVLPGILLLSIGYIENIPILLTIWFIAVIFVTASYAGAMANIVDIAPNYAGPVLAFCQTIHMSASFLSPLTVGVIVTNTSSIDQWRTIFILASVIAVLTYCMYQIFGTAEVQKWNRLESSNDAENLPEERQVLQQQQNIKIISNNNK